MKTMIIKQRMLITFQKKMRLDKKRDAPGHASTIINDQNYYFYKALAPNGAVQGKLSSIIY